MEPHSRVRGAPANDIKSPPAVAEVPACLDAVLQALDAAEFATSPTGPIRVRVGG
ncbi:hypothetical protein [Actinomadura sp. CNU-125]|uniref:hypothetical protein n=1 Tax=Actinomadura sp. CNU-125 TaxID=1904961 RepID=UPI0013016AB1|nr:hypothetical protein [Actinomadura sp. CNU-125]